MFSAMISSILTVLQITFAILLIVLILLQQQGSGLGAAFGGSSNIYSTKRGIDRVIFRMTIAVAILFFGVSIGILLVS